MKTRREVIDQAMRKLGVLAEDEVLTAAQIAEADEVLQGLYGELEAEVAPSWTIDDVPQAAFLPLANLLASELAASFRVAPPVTRANAWLRLLANLRAAPSPEADPVYY